MIIACPCGATYSVSAAASVAIERCPTCGTGATVPPPARDVYGDGLFDDVEAGYGGRRVDNREQWLAEARARLRWMGLSPGTEILEIGAATGEFVAVAEHDGFTVTGLETSPRAVADAAAITTKVVHQDLAEWRNDHAGKQVGAVAMFHVLEHIDDPRTFLHELREVIAPGGCLYLEVPNGASVGCRRDGAQWWAARVEDHYFHYSPQGLRSLLRSAGFDGVSMRPVTRHVYERLTTSERLTIFAKELVKPLFGKPGRSRDLLRAIAVRPADG